MSWQTTKTIAALDEKKIHVYLVNIDQLSDQYQHLHTEEKQRADSMPIAKYRQRSINARGFLRKLLKTSEPFLQAEKGKLSLSDSSIRFNVAHSQDLALYAINLNDEIGVDIEGYRHMKDESAIAIRVFSSEEIKYLESKGEQTFFTLWSRKEAVIKMTGDGLGAPLKSIITTCASGELVVPVRYPGHEHIELIDLPNIDQFAAALAGQLSHKQIQYYLYNTYY